ATKMILRYLHDTSHFGLHYTRGSTQLVGYTDSDWVGSIDDRRSTSSYLFCVGSSPVAWVCKKAIGYYTFIFGGRVESNSY
ncbi:hypothetical protein KI387_043808, partial [Taxus chinensis]